MSHTRLCVACGFAIENANAYGINEKSGPYFQHWARRSLMAMHRLLLDDDGVSA